MDSTKGFLSPFFMDPQSTHHQENTRHFSERRSQWHGIMESTPLCRRYAQQHNSSSYDVTNNRLYIIEWQEINDQRGKTASPLYEKFQLLCRWKLAPSLCIRFNLLPRYWLVSASLSSQACTFPASKFRVISSASSS